MSKVKDFDLLAAKDMSALTAEAAGITPPTKLVTLSSTVAARAAAAERMRADGGLLSKSPLTVVNPYTVEVATTQKYPLRKFRLSELVVHPYNVRPESGSSELSELTAKLAAEGQLDPIHVVPYLDGFAIMEGQRRWLAAPAAGISELDGWLHPAPTDPFEVYAFGQMIHDSRKDSTAFDQAVVWNRMIRDKVFASAAELARRLQLLESQVSRALKIVSASKLVLDEIRQAPARFTHRHLYAIAQINEAADDATAAEIAHSVVVAPAENPVTARRLDALAATFVKTGGGPTRGRRKNSVPLSIRSSSGQVMGSIKSYRDGRLEFMPASPLPEDVAERVAQAVRSLFTAELQSHFEKAQTAEE